MARLFFPAPARGFSPSKLLGRLWPGLGAPRGPQPGHPGTLQTFVPLEFDFPMNGAPWVTAQPRGPGEAWLGLWECRINHSCDSDMA